MTVHDGTIRHISGALNGQNRVRHGRCSGACHKSEPEIGIMGTEVLILGVTFSLYALCALFVRICDRI